MIGCLTMIESTGAANGPSPAAEQTTLMQSALRGLACKCPRCGKGRLYAGFLTLEIGRASCRERV